MRLIITIIIILLLLIVGTFVFLILRKNGVFLNAGGSKSIMTLHTGKPYEIILNIKMGEIPEGTNVTINNKLAKEGDNIRIVTINNKLAKEGDNIRIGDTIEIEWGEHDST